MDCARRIFARRNGGVRCGNRKICPVGEGLKFGTSEAMEQCLLKISVRKICPVREAGAGRRKCGTAEVRDATNCGNREWSCDHWHLTLNGCTWTAHADFFARRSGGVLCGNRKICSVRECLKCGTAEVRDGRSNGAVPSQDFCAQNLSHAGSSGRRK